MLIGCAVTRREKVKGESVNRRRLGRSPDRGNLLIP